MTEVDDTKIWQHATEASYQRLRGEVPQIMMSDQNVPDIPKGTWVQVWAQVVEQEGVHPEDFVLQFESHNADFKVPIKRSDVTVPDEQPSWVAKCTALAEVDVTQGDGQREVVNTYLVRCEGNALHDDDHHWQNKTWPTRNNVGHFEEV